MALLKKVFVFFLSKVNLFPDPDYFIRNGKTQTGYGRQDYRKMSFGRKETKREYESRRRNSRNDDKGLHESLDWYDKCIFRQRNSK